MKKWQHIKLTVGLSSLILLFAGCAESNLPVGPEIDDDPINPLDIPFFKINTAAAGLNDIVYLNTLYDGGPNSVNHKIYTVNADGSNQTLIAEDFSAGFLSFAVSPVNSHIAFTKVEQGADNILGISMFEIDVETQSVTGLMNLPGIRNFAAGLPLLPRVIDGPVYSSNGGDVHFGMINSATEAWDLFSVDFAADAIVNLTNHITDDILPVPSPDGSKIAFISRRSPVDSLNGLGEQVFVMNMDGSELRRVSAGLATLAHMPSWSPDGSQLVYTDDNSLFVVNADGSNRRKIVDRDVVGGNSRHGSFSPDGTKIVFDLHPLEGRDGFGGSELYTVGVDGTNLTQLTNIGASNKSAQWSPDGTKLLFESEGFLNPDATGAFMKNNTSFIPGRIYVINADGTNLLEMKNEASDTAIVHKARWVR